MWTQHTHWGNTSLQHFWVLPYARTLGPTQGELHNMGKSVWSDRHTHNLERGSPPHATSLHARAAALLQCKSYRVFTQLTQTPAMDNKMQTTVYCNTTAVPTKTPQQKPLCRAYAWVCMLLDTIQPPKPKKIDHELVCSMQMHCRSCPQNPELHHETVAVLVRPHCRQAYPGTCQGAGVGVPLGVLATDRLIRQLTAAAATKLANFLPGVWHRLACS